VHPLRYDAELSYNRVRAQLEIPSCAFAIYKPFYRQTLPQNRVIIHLTGENKMPQYQQHKKGQARIRILSKDATRIYMFLMQKTGGKLQALPNEVYVVDEAVLATLTENKIEYELIEDK